MPGKAALKKTDRKPTTDRRRRTYSPPRLKELGRLACLTLGGSPGIGDSGPTSEVSSPML